LQIVIEIIQLLYNILSTIHTNHLGDSGMKYSPGISIPHGITPAKEKKLANASLY